MATTLHTLTQPRRSVGPRTRAVAALLLIFVLLLGVWLPQPAPAAATSANAGTVAAQASVSPSVVAAGAGTTVTATVTGTVAQSVLIDLEIYAPGGARVWQQFWDNQRLAAGQPLACAAGWSVPATTPPGTYTVKVGVFTPGWGTLLVWNDAATTLSVAGSAPTATTAPSRTPSPSATAVPPTATATSTPRPPTATPTSPPPTATVVPPTPTAVPPTPTATATATATPAPATPTAALPTPTTAVNPTVAPSGDKLFGVNVAGAEFGESSLPGTLGTTYTYATDSYRASYSYFAGNGLTLVRLPFRWERVQPSPFGALSPTDVQGLRGALDAAGASGQRVILDMHNYARYYNAPLGRADAARLADVWGKLAQTFAGHPALYGYELMNEPHDLPDGPDGWAALAQAATHAVRRYDTNAVILVPGYGWQGAWSWPQNNPNLNVVDPANRLLYAAHQYFDHDYSGSYTGSYPAEGAYPARGVDLVQPFLSWLASRNAYGILTEYGVPADDARWNTLLDQFLGYVQASPRLQGGTYWAAGPWWGAYPLSVEPVNGQDRPQMAVLAAHRSGPAPVATATPTATPAGPAPSLAADATAAPAAGSAGSPVVLTAGAWSASARPALVDLEVFGPTGTRVFQQFWDNQSLPAGQHLTWTANWTPPAGSAAGTYNVKVGLFGPGWNGVLVWNDAAASFSLR